MNWLLGFIPAPYQLTAKIVTGIALCAALLFAWHQFTGCYVDIGKQSRQAEVDALNLQLQRSIFAAQQCNQSVADMQTASNNKKAASTLALAEAQQRASGLQEQSAWLLAQLNKPEAKSKGCADALKEWRTQP